MVDPCVRQDKETLVERRKEVDPDERVGGATLLASSAGWTVKVFVRTGEALSPALKAIAEMLSP